MVKKLKKSVFIVLMVFALPTMAVDIAQHPQLNKVVDELVQEKIYTKSELERLFAKVQINQKVLDAMQNPAEYKLTWGKYRKIFIQASRSQLALEFWSQHQDALQRAQSEYGVPIPIILSIIGVESKYGQNKGQLKVLDSLTTLSIGYKRRSAFFTKELKQFLILCKESKLDIANILGSYAGAMGFGQFISSSYLNYGVDFNKNGKIDLINEPVDAIGSIANYLKENGWKNHGKIVSQVYANIPKPAAALANRKRSLQFSAKELRNKSVRFNASIQDDEKINLLALNANPNVPPSKQKNTYIVRVGDTICEIAKRSKVSCKALRSLNKINARGDIFRDQKLQLPKGSVVKDTSIQYEEQPVYFVTHHNFYVIMRYNISVLYAMVIYDLAEEIALAKQRANPV